MAARARNYASRIKKNDIVMVIAGRDRGKTGKVMRVIPERGRVVIERLNVVKRHSRRAARPARAESSKKRRRWISPT